MNMRGMGCALYIRCTLSIHQKECRRSLGCALYIGARYLPENTVLASQAESINTYSLYFSSFLGYQRALGS
jgi:hypothetical protein